MNAHATLLAVSMLMLSATAAADARLVFDTGERDTSSLAIGDGRARVQQDGDPRHVFLFEENGRGITIIDHEERSFHETDAASLAAQGREMSAQMQQMREQMEKQLQGLPESQRAAVRAQLEKQFPALAANDAQAPVQIARSGKSERVAGVACEPVTVTRDGRARQRLCVASPDSLGLSRADAATLEALMRTLGDIAESFGGTMAGPQVPPRVVEQLGGVPIRGQDVSSGRSWQLRDVDTASLAADTFRVPAGYQEKESLSFGAQ